jgi:hypothetical protein
MPALHERAFRPPVAMAPSAVVWIDAQRARVARMRPDGEVSTCEIDRGSLAEPAYLGHVVRAIGDRERVLIFGPNAVRLALEREYVSIFRRPDRLVDVEPVTGELGPDELVDLLRGFAA